MVDEIITSLSRIGWLIVASRTSHLSLACGADIRDIAWQIESRYVLRVASQGW
jgi:TolB-like protein